MRVPWLRAAPIKAGINRRTTQPVLAGSHRLFERVRTDDEIAVPFPVTESVRSYAIIGVQHHLTFRGSTVVDVSPGPRVPRTYPTYQREHMGAVKARW